MLRRTFLGTGSLAGLAAAAPAAAPGQGIKLGFDTYSINAWRWKDIQYLDYAASLKLDSVQLSSLNDYESLEPAHLQRVKDHAARLGIQIDSGADCVCPSSARYDRASQGDAVAYTLKGLRVAHAVGSKVMRCYLGTREDRQGALPIEAHMENIIKVFRAVRSQALDMGVKIAIENHAGDLQAREIRTVIEEAGKDYVGACLDTGNPLWAVEDPFVTVETLAPYVVTTHVRDSAVFEHPRGAAVQWVALGDGSIDMVRYTEMHRRLFPHAAMQLEIITTLRTTVIPYLEPDFWKPYPKMPAWEFARFVALAKKGQPYMGSILVPGRGRGPAIREAIKEQQKIDLERSLDYAKQKLGIGLKWKA